MRVVRGMKINLPLDRDYLLLDCLPVHACFIRAADKLGMEVERLAYLVCWNFGNHPENWPAEVDAKEQNEEGN